MVTRVSHVAEVVRLLKNLFFTQQICALLNSYEFSYPKNLIWTKHFGYLEVQNLWL